MKRRTPPRYPNKLLVAGVVTGIGGSLLLLWNFGYLPQPGRLWPVGLILVGLVFLYLAWPKGRSDRWLIPGMVFTLGGIVLLLMNTVLAGQNIARIWPAFMLVTGISLVPYGFRRKGGARTAIVIPALFICCLSIVFFPFAVNHTAGGFAAFVRQWWPMIFVILGLLLVVSFFTMRRPRSKV